jgi:hypothetical protein
METRETMPLCDGGMSEDCFHFEEMKVARRDATKGRKAFTQILDWTHGTK